MEARASEWSRVQPRRATAWVEPAHLGAVAPQRLRPSTPYRYVMGVDAGPVVMPATEIATLNDPLASLLKQGRFPLTAEAVLTELNAAGTLPEQTSFLVSEAGQIPPQQAPSLVRDMRFAVVRGRPSEADLLISASAVGDPRTTFLQIAAWDEQAGLFNYYMRLDETWAWVGNSYHALEAPSRGQGCFDSHVNGSLVMKELKQPWLNWQSMNATIKLADDDPLRQNPLYRSLSGAEELEHIVRAGISRWTAARLKHAAAGDGRLDNVDRWLRQLCTSTTVNLTSTATESSVAVANPATRLVLPLGFWFNADTLLDVLGIPAEFEPPGVSGDLYANSLARYDFALEQGDFRQKGDTFFAFVVPEAAFEDNEVVNQLVRSGILTAHFVASVLMVDFPNPVFSAARASLLQYVPDSAVPGDLSAQTAAAIIKAAQNRPPDSPEAEFATNWALPEAEWKDVFASRIQNYMAAVSRRIATAEGFDDYVRLAESRRNEFRRMRLNEFSLTLPVTTIPRDSLLQIQPDGTVQDKPAPP